jgi:hypothetical protein
MVACCHQTRRTNGLAIRTGSGTAEVQSPTLLHSRMLRRSIVLPTTVMTSTSWSIVNWKENQTLSSGLHYFDPKDQDFMFVSMVAENKKEFMKRQIQRAKVARSLYCKLGFLSMKDYKFVIQKNQIKDCPVTVTDIDITFKIWGKDMQC